MAAAARPGPEELALLEQLLGLPKGNKYGVQGERKVKGARRGRERAGAGGWVSAGLLPRRPLTSPLPLPPPRPRAAVAPRGERRCDGGNGPSTPSLPGGPALRRPRLRIPARPALPLQRGFAFSASAPSFAAPLRFWL